MRVEHETLKIPNNIKGFSALVSSRYSADDAENAARASVEPLGKSRAARDDLLIDFNATHKVLFMATKRGEDLESDAIAKVRAELGRPLNAAIRAFNLISEVVQLEPRGGKLSNPMKVRLLLLQRIITDLRCCTILAERGYGIQAAAGAACVFEGWVTLSAIRDEQAAIEWASHQKEDVSFGQIKKLTKAAVKSIVDDTKDVERLAAQHYDHYRQLCMAKHLNPIVERNRGFIRRGKEIEFIHGPDLSKQGLRHTHYAIHSSALFAMYGLGALCCLEGPPLSGAMMLEVSSIHAELQATQPGRKG
jgi:hypothetical protein